MKREFQILINDIMDCQLCAEHFDYPPRPVFQLHSGATILIAGQAPGHKVHKSGIPFDDPSGDRLRDWMGVSKTIFYDETKIAILPMGLCYPGQGPSGDLPPRKECALKWRQQVLDRLPGVQLTIVIGRYAMEWHLRLNRTDNLTDIVRNWQQYTPSIYPMPHPSPRNNIWLSKNPWFEKCVIPSLRRNVLKCLG